MTPSPATDTVSTALLIIDVQRALTTGQWAAFDSPGVVQRINRVARLVRSAGAPVIAIQHEGPDSPLEYGTDDWQLDADLDVTAEDIRLRKTASDSFHNTKLHAVLQERGVTSLIVCGLQSDFCVDSTVRRALALGYPVTLVSDGHTTVDNSVLSAAQISAHHNITLAGLDSYGPRVHAVPAADVRIER